LSRIGFRAKLGRSREKRREDRVGFLVENFHIDPKQLVAVGFGEEKLKNPENPLAAENSRVQVVNMANKEWPTRTLRPKPLHPLPAPAGREAAAVIW
jgi:hypothetical protein